jgi:hypothetical protein
MAPSSLMEQAVREESEIATALLPQQPYKIRGCAAAVAALVSTENCAGFSVM